MLLHDLGTDRRRPVLVEVMRHDLHCGIGQLGAIGSCVLSAVDLTRLHLRKPLKRQSPHGPSVGTPAGVVAPATLPVNSAATRMVPPKRLISVLPRSSS